MASLLLDCQGWKPELFRGYLGWGLLPSNSEGAVYVNCSGANLNCLGIALCRQ